MINGETDVPEYLSTLLNLPAKSLISDIGESDLTLPSNSMLHLLSHAIHVHFQYSNAFLSDKIQTGDRWQSQKGLTESKMSLKRAPERNS